MVVEPEFVARFRSVRAVEDTGGRSGCGDRYGESVTGGVWRIHVPGDFGECRWRQGHSISEAAEAGFRLVRIHPEASEPDEQLSSVHARAQSAFGFHGEPVFSSRIKVYVRVLSVSTHRVANPLEMERRTRIRTGSSVDVANGRGHAVGIARIELVRRRHRRVFRSAYPHRASTVSRYVFHPRVHVFV